MLSVVGERLFSLFYLPEIEVCHDVVVLCISYPLSQPAYRVSGTTQEDIDQELRKFRDDAIDVSST
jgi:hypothetical protein